MKVTVEGFLMDSLDRYGDHRRHLDGLQGLFQLGQQLRVYRLGTRWLARINHC
jgi:hypothetical protein